MLVTLRNGKAVECSVALRHTSDIAVSFHGSSYSREPDELHWQVDTFDITIADSGQLKLWDHWRMGDTLFLYLSALDDAENDATLLVDGPMLPSGDCEERVTKTGNGWRIRFVVTGYEPL